MIEKKRILAIIGASGHGMVIADAAERLGIWSRIEFYDDAFPEKSGNAPYSISGTLNDALSHVKSEYDFALGIGSNEIRLQKLVLIQSCGFNLPPIIHPSAVISQHAEINAGSFIAPGAIVNARAKIGCAVIVNTNAVVEHDCILSDGVHVSPSASIGGAVVVGERTWIGIGACIKNNLSIGANCVIGAGSVVVSNIPDNSVVYGNPAKHKGHTC